MRLQYAVAFETEFKMVAEANMNMKLKSLVEVYFKDTYYKQIRTGV